MVFQSEQKSIILADIGELVVVALFVNSFVQTNLSVVSRFPNK